MYCHRVSLCLCTLLFFSWAQWKPLSKQHFQERNKASTDYKDKEDCIPVGCVPPAYWPYRPAYSAPGGVCSGGVSAWGVSAQGGVYLVLGGVPGPSGGVPGPRGVSAPGGVCSRGVYLVLGGVWSWGCVSSPRGMYLVLGGVYLVWGCLVPGGVCSKGVCTWSWGVYLDEGISAPGGVSAPGGLLQGVSGTPPLSTEWQTGAKILPCPTLRLWVVNIPLWVICWQHRHCSAGNINQCHSHAWLNQSIKPIN